MSKILEQLGTISVDPTQGTVPQNLENTVDQKSKTNGESKKADVDKEHYLRDLEKVISYSLPEIYLLKELFLFQLTVSSTYSSYATTLIHRSMIKFASPCVQLKSKIFSLQNS